MDAQEAREILAEIREIESHDEHDTGDLRRAAQINRRTQAAAAEADRATLQRELGTPRHGISGRGPTRRDRSRRRDPERRLGPQGALQRGRAARGRDQDRDEDRERGQHTRLSDAVPSRFAAPDLGVDSRYVFPRVRTISVQADTTGVQSYRQKSRTLASPSDMVRDLDAVSPAKPESVTVAEIVNEELKMVATVSSGVPNVLLQSTSFRG